MPLDYSRIDELDEAHFPFLKEPIATADGLEFQAKNTRLQEIENEMQQGEIEQTNTLTDRQVVELVENAIRARPQDFPFLAKYYLNAE